MLILLNRLTRWQLLDVERAARDARAAGDHAVSVHGVTRFFGPPGGAQPPQQKEEPCSSSSAAGADAAPAAAASKRKQRSAARLDRFLRRRKLLAAAVLQLKLHLSVVRLQRAWRRLVAGRAAAARLLASAEMSLVQATTFYFETLAPLLGLHLVAGVLCSPCELLTFFGWLVDWLVGWSVGRSVGWCCELGLF